jgi:hypothetical protein
MWTSLLITGAIACLVQTGITYPSYAPNRGWPVSEWATKDGWYLYHGFAALSVLFAAWKYGALTGILFVVAFSFIGAFALAHILRSWSQAISLLSLPTALVWHWSIP